MDFINTEAFNFFWKVIATIGMVGLCYGLIKSAAASLKRTGKWTSVLDEIGVGILLIFVYIIIMQNPASTIFNFLVTPIVFLWNLALAFFRQLGFPL
ncbi:putative integral membrane protein [Breznakia sp. PF5-3]|uniref:molybdenum ABC transporter substrate-binding protein n=1 Tax=unclassified Breznakia TaxID=2623764 RepID=UPI002405848B|nr:MULTISPECIES: molybdenum ABC transporter substrate-binding protein [unclassified Breznakia]MDF9825182.1 putative integral membrane protein [Breznakia sp. PM6-1]MDF9836040.1 putative integral membrane protein [Breznakia sp. PF5-3]MDF9838599.1 putative integral membrane protein [Breznakia sp. PFB2-8]MDF9860632.1 putative integral membrane protein [Breznakia sp. PH5-24]